MPHGYQNIDGGNEPTSKHSGIHIKPMTYQELNQRPVHVESSPLVPQESSLKGKKIAALVMCTSIFALAAFASNRPTAAILGHSNAHHHHKHDKNHNSEAPANDEGAFCCHYSTVATDACNTCQAPSTTGHCAIAADNCTACGGAWCLPSTPAPTPVNYTKPLPGICCHYATDITDVCGTCKAPDNGDCGKDAESCAACGGGSGSGWCQALTAPKSVQNTSTTPTSSPPATAGSEASSKPVDTEAAASTSDKHATSGSADTKTAESTSDDKHKLAGSAGTKTTPPPPASDDNDNTPF